MENQEEYMELQLLSQQLDELEQSVNQATTQMEHAQIAMSVLEELKDAKGNQELLVPIGSGTFLEVQAKNTKVKTVVGANVVVEKTPQETLSSLQVQLVEIQSYQQKSAELYNDVVNKINILQNKIEAKK